MTVNREESDVTNGVTGEPSRMMADLLTALADADSAARALASSEGEALRQRLTTVQYQAVRTFDLLAEIGRQLGPLTRQAIRGVDGAEDEAAALCRRLVEEAMKGAARASGR